MVPASRILPGVLADVIRKAPLTHEKVAFAWRVAVGAEVAKATDVRLSEEGVLEVTAIDAHWALEVRRARTLIRSRLSTYLGTDTVRRIETTPGASARPKRRQP